MEYLPGDFSADLGTILTEGQWVCEQALWLRWTYFGKLIARTPCEIFRVNAQEFRDVVLSHDTSLEFVMLYASLYIEYIGNESHVGGWMTDVWTNVEQHQKLAAQA